MWLNVRITVFICKCVWVLKLIMLVLSFFCHIAMATVPSRGNGGRVRQSYLFSPFPSLPSFLQPPITLSFPPSLHLPSSLPSSSRNLSLPLLSISFLPLLFLPLRDWLNTLLLKMRYCLMRQRVKKRGGRQRASVLKKKQWKYVEEVICADSSLLHVKKTSVMSLWRETAPDIYTCMYI